MADWFRSWHGAPTDPKWLGIARKANVAPGVVVAIAWALMDRASQSADRGSISGYDADGLAAFFGCDAEQVESIVDGMRAKGVLKGDRFHAWEKRQPKREDGAAERAKQWRERKQTQKNVDEPPERERDTEEERNSLSHARDPQIDFNQEIVTAYQQAGSMHVPDTHHAEIWLKRGYDPVICLATIRSILARKPNVPLKYFDGAIADAHVKPVGQARAGPRDGAPKRSNVVIAVEKALERERTSANSGQNTGPAATARGSGVVVDAEPGSWVAG